MREKVVQIMISGGQGHGKTLITHVIEEALKEHGVEVKIMDEEGEDHYKQKAVLFGKQLRTGTGFAPESLLNTTAVVTQVSKDVRDKLDRLEKLVSGYEENEEIT